MVRAVALVGGDGEVGEAKSEGCAAGLFCKNYS